MINAWNSSLIWSPTFREALPTAKWRPPAPLKSSGPPSWPGKGNLLRLWKPPAEPGVWRTWGLFRAADETELQSILATMPLHKWMTVRVTPLTPHPNDPGSAEHVISVDPPAGFRRDLAVEHPVDEPVQHLPVSRRARFGSSAVAMAMAASSSAPISTWANGRTGCRASWPARMASVSSCSVMPRLYRWATSRKRGPAEHAGRIQQHQLTHLRIAGDLQPGVDRGPDRVRRCRRSRLGHQGGHPGHHILLHHLDDLAE